MASLRIPSAWADAQRELHAAYDRDPTPFPRQPVQVTWVTRGDLDPMPSPDPAFDGEPRADVAGGSVLIGAPKALGGFLWRIATAWRHGVVPHDGLEVTVIAEDGGSMTFTLSPDPAPHRPKGSTDGVLVGELGTNAAACLEVDGRVLWPTTPPVERPRP